MANPAKFYESQAGDDYEAVAVTRVQMTDETLGFISCWKLTPQELEEVMKTGRIWLTVMGDTHPGVAVNGIKPF